MKTKNLFVLALLLSVAFFASTFTSSNHAMAQSVTCKTASQTCYVVEIGHVKVKSVRGLATIIL